MVISGLWVSETAQTLNPKTLTPNPKPPRISGLSESLPPENPASLGHPVKTDGLSRRLKPRRLEEPLLTSQILGFGN